MSKTEESLKGKIEGRILDRNSSLLLQNLDCNFMLFLSLIQAMFPPPCYQYVAWGYGDLSLRIGQLDGDKVSVGCLFLKHNGANYFPADDKGHGSCLMC